MKLPWLPIEPLAEESFGQVRRRAIFDCCKWDPQVEDLSALSAQPVLLTPAAWEELSALASALATETLAAEDELRCRPDLHKRLGLGWRLRSALELAGRGAPARSPRVMRFDFHFTAEGWRISEANTDVPGGFNEASGFTALMAEHYPELATAGDVVELLTDAIAECAPKSGVIAMVHATAYSDDYQVMEFIARRLRQSGLHPVMIGPDNVNWEDDQPWVAERGERMPVDLIYRFFPAEWLTELAGRSGWRNFFSSPSVPCCNPGTALLTQTKRFPIVWDRLDTELSTWRRLLPETRDPREVNWRYDPHWVVKPALGRVGGDIGMAGVTSARDWQAIRSSIRWAAGEWVAQRRFQAVPLCTDMGEVYPCFGVYTVGTRAAGIYGRHSRVPLIDHRACDAAVLVAPALAPCGPPSQPPNRHELMATV